MVSTRIVTMIPIVILFSSLGSEWIAYDSGGLPGSLGIMGVTAAISSVYGPCNCPPPNNSIDGEFVLFIVSKLVALGPLAFSLLIYPIALVSSAMSVFRWRWTLVAGALALVSGLLWVVGVDAVSGSIARGLSDWYGYGGRSISSSVWAPIGSYQVAVAGVVFVLIFFLSRMDKLDTPID